jgi:small-conductance mechanosensitive channel
MIGSASSKYFEGLLFILVRRPYNIGDLINVSNVEVQTSFDGAPGWIVENVTLFETEW